MYKALTAALMLVDEVESEESASNVINPASWGKVISIQYRIKRESCRFAIDLAK